MQINVCLYLNHSTLKKKNHNQLLCFLFFKTLKSADQTQVSNSNRSVHCSWVLAERVALPNTYPSQDIFLGVTVQHFNSEHQCSVSKSTVPSHALAVRFAIVSYLIHRRCTSHSLQGSGSESDEAKPTLKMLGQDKASLDRAQARWVERLPSPMMLGSVHCKIQNML